MRKLLFILIFLPQVINAQKLIVLASLSKNFTAYRTNSLFVINDSIYYYLSKTQPGFNLNIPLPAIAYEFKNQNRISITPQLFREEVNFLDSSEYRQYRDGISYLDGEGSNKIITKFRRLDLNYEYNVFKQSQKSFSIFGGLSYSWRGRRYKMSYNNSKYELKENDKRNELLEMFKRSGNYISFNAGIAYKYKRLQVLFGGGSSILTFKNEEKIITKQVFMQIGLKYDVFKKTYFNNQLKNNYALNTEMNVKKSFDLSFNIRYDIINLLKQTGEQSYFYNGAGPDKNNYYAFVFKQKPIIKTSPDFALQAKWLLKNKPIGLRAAVGSQTLKFNYTKAVYTISNNKISQEDEKDFFIKTYFTLGAEKQIRLKDEINLFYAADVGINNFFTADFGGLIENLSTRVEDDSDLKKFTPMADVQFGCLYKRFNLHFMYTIIPNKISNSGEYILKNYQQIKIGLAYSILERRRND